MEKNRPLAFIFVLLLSVNLFGLDISQGAIGLQINERNGSFIIKDTQQKQSFFFEEDPRTTFLSLKESNNTYVLGKGSTFEVTVSQTAKGAKTVYQNPFYIITLDFNFIVSRESMVANGVSLEITIKNISEKSTRVGLLMLMDTYLGEKGDHFQLSAGRKVTSETAFSSDMPLYWVSSAKGKPGLMVMTSSLSGATQPSQVVFANWKRLEENLWNLKPDSSRDFNLPPYSFNDSAVAHFYPDQVMNPQEERKIKILLGIENKDGFNLNQGAGLSPVSEMINSSEIFDSTQEEGGVPSLKKEYSAVLDLLDNINDKLQSPESVSEDELKVLLEVLRELERRQESYLQ